MAKFKPVRIIKRDESYQLNFYSPRGERRRLSVGTDCQYAQRLAVKFNDWLMEGKDPEREIKKTFHEEQARQITLQTFSPEFIKRHGKYQSKSMQEIYRYRFKNIKRCPHVSEIPLSDITKRLLYDYTRLRMEQEGVSPSTVNRETTMIKTMLNKAVEWELIASNPLQGFKLFPEPKRDVSVTIEEASHILKFLSKPLAEIVEFAFYTGFRKENILSLRIEQIRFNDVTTTGEVELVTKGSKREIFPLSSNAVLVLKRVIGKRNSGYVFLNTHTRYHSINKSFDFAVRKVGLMVNGTKFRFHDIRHVFANTLIRNGARLDDIRILLGHENRTTTDRYTSKQCFDSIRYIESVPSLRTMNKEESSKTIAV